MLRYSAQFFLIGSVLLAGSLVWSESTKREAVARVSTDASAGEVARAVDEAILLAEARRYGWHQTDPVVFQHLVRNMDFVDQDESAGPMVSFQRALDLGMDKTDPVVRSRLLHRARQSLMFVPEDREPTTEDLEAHLQRYPERFSTSPRLRFVHVFLNKERRGDQLYADTQRILGDLRRAALSPAEAHKLGDPLLGARAVETATIAQLDAKYGPSFAEGIERAKLDQWFGPLTTVYGLHLVRVISRGTGEPLPLQEIRNQVRADLIRDLREELGRERLAALRAAYDVRVEKVP